MGFLVRRVPGRGPERRESDKTLHYPQLVVRGKNYSVEAWCHCKKVWCMAVLLSKRELNSLPWCLLVCNLVVLLVAIEWTATITGDCVGFFLDFSPRRKMFGNHFPGWKPYTSMER
jgi:hypothetical protein